MNEKKRHYSTLKSNKSKKQKSLPSVEILDFSNLSEDPDTAYAQLLSKIDQLELKNHKRSEVKAIYIKLIQNRCLRGDHFKELRPDRAITYYQEALELFKDLQIRNGVKLDSIENFSIEHLLEEDIKQKANIFYNLYALYSVKKESTYLEKAMQMLNASMQYYDCLAKQNASLYQEEFNICKIEKENLQKILADEDRVELINEPEDNEEEVIDAEEIIDGIPIFSDRVLEGISRLYKFAHASYALKAIASNQYPLTFNCKDESEAQALNNWLLKVKTLKAACSKLQILLDRNTLMVADPKTVFHLKQWQKANFSILEAVKDKKWGNIFEIVFSQNAFKNKKIPYTRVSKLLNFYYKKVLRSLPETDKKDFEVAYQNALKMAELRNAKSRKAAEKRAKKKADQAKKNQPTEKELSPSPALLNQTPITTSPTLFGYNFTSPVGSSFMPNVQDSGTSVHSIDLNGQKQSTSSKEITHFLESDQNNLLMNIELAKSELEKASVQELKRKHEEMVMKLQQKLITECNSIIIEIRNLEKELNKEEDKNITLVGELSIAILRGKKQSFQNKLQELTTEIQKELKTLVFEIRSVWQNIQEFSSSLKISEDELVKPKNFTEMKSLINLKEEYNRLAEESCKLETRFKNKMISEIVDMKKELGSYEPEKSSNFNTRLFR